MRIVAAVLCCVILVFLPLGAASAQTGVGWPLEPTVHPIDGGAEADTFYALFATNCGHPALDPRRAPEVTLGGPGDNAGIVGTIEVRYFVIEPATPVCPAVKAPDTLVPIRLGPLAKGAWVVVHRYALLDAAGAPIDAPWEFTAQSSLAVSDTPHHAVSGTWFDAASPGTGVSLSLTPDGAAAPTAVLFIAGVSDDGAPRWLTGAGKFVDGVLDIPLTVTNAAAGGGSSVEDAGTARFTYAGCGAAQLELDADTGLRAPAATATLRQLTTTLGVPSCEPPLSRPSTD